MILRRLGQLATRLEEHLLDARLHQPKNGQETRQATWRISVVYLTSTTMPSSSPEIEIGLYTMRRIEVGVKLERKGPVTYFGNDAAEDYQWHIQQALLPHPASETLDYEGGGLALMIRA